MSMIQIKSVYPFFLSLILLLFLLTGSSQLAFASTTDQHMLSTGEILLSQGKYLESIGLLNEIIAHSTDNDIKSSALFLIANAENIYLNNPDAALKNFIKIIYQFPDTAAASKALFQVGILLFDKQEYRKANVVFSKYIQDYPSGLHIKDAEIWIQIVKPFLSQKRKIKPEIQTKRRHPLPVSKATPRVRVLIKREMDRIEFRSRNQITVTNCKDPKKIYSGWGPVQFTTRNGIMKLNNQPLSQSTYRITSESSILHINNTPYRGSFVVTTESGNGLLYAINHVEIENYLYGVVPKEMPDSWEDHALMAQAVAARTYALYIREKCNHPFYDLEATTASQVYGGIPNESERSTKAINLTRGQVMTHDGRLIIAYFHSDSGGHTEDPSNVWSTERIPYLNGFPDQFSQEQPQQTWEYFLSYRDAIKQLNLYGLGISKLDRIIVKNRSRSGRFSKVLIYSNKGVSELSSNQFRASIGETRIKSTLFHLYPRQGGFLFKGKGYGHGVGMSQWGARRMAQAGSSYQDILKFYYKGIKIKKL